MPVGTSGAVNIVPECPYRSGRDHPSRTDCSRRIPWMCGDAARNVQDYSMSGPKDPPRTQASIVAAGDFSRPHLPRFEPFLTLWPDSVVLLGLRLFKN